MKNKYYIPDISEFCVGFEYEYKNHDGTIRDLSNIEWKKSMVDSINDLAYVERGLNTPNNTRVKHLDKEDIESLGFELIKIHPGTTSHYFELKNYKTSNDGTICIDFNPDFRDRIYLRIYYFYGSLEDEIDIFNGRPKNKSELKKVLQMCNIITKDNVI